MSSYNRVILVGNLTRDPELRYIPSGTAVCEIGLAVNDRVKKGGEWTDEVSFFDVVYFGRTAEVLCEHCSKGSNILVDGRLRQERFESNGQQRSKVKVMGDKMQMLGSRGGRSQSSEYSEPSGKTDWQAEGAKLADDSSIPF